MILYKCITMNSEGKEGSMKFGTVWHCSASERMIDYFFVYAKICSEFVNSDSVRALVRS